MALHPRPLVIIVRVQSANHGTKRIQCLSSDSVSVFLNMVKEEFDIQSTVWNVYKARNKTGLLSGSKRSTLNTSNIRHGDMVYLDCDEPTASTSDQATNQPIHGSLAGSFRSSASDVPPSARTTSQQSSRATPQPTSLRSDQASLKIDEVDEKLEKQDGLIHRPRNEQLCHHGPSGKCLHCVPLEPYDEGHLRSAEPPIKFLSFHSYQRKLTGGVDKGKFAILENLRCKIRPGCKEHPPWPGGICTKCQPNAVTLNRQTYRHVDHIIIENPSIADQFLNYWRNTGCQRLGILYGRYDEYPNVPLGIKATVHAIYEPPQISKKSHIELLEDMNEAMVMEVAGKLGMVALGWIFTDLVADDLSKGTVKHFRGHINSHFLGAEECIMAARLQNKYPNPCRLSPHGHFGSKFVTIVVTGDSSNQVHFDGYQVSNQCMALVRDECFIPTKDAPELGYIKESSNAQYVPDVFYKEKDEYGNEVTQLARPLPVEYLLVDMPVTFPVDPQYTYNMATSYKNFVVENRSQLGDIQDFNSFMVYMEQFSQTDFLKAVSDFHLLLFLASSHVLPLKDHLGMLLEAVKTKDSNLGHEFKRTEEWATVEEMFAAHVPSPATARSDPMQTTPSAAATPKWTCIHCTFINDDGNINCEMCSLPKQ